MQTEKRNRRRGNTLIEFTFVALPLLATIFGAIEIDRMLLVYTSVANSARAGVRYAIVHGHYNPVATQSVEQVVETFARIGGLDLADLNVQIVYGDDDKSIGSQVSVSVAYSYTPFTSFFPLNPTLRSTSRGTIAF